MSSTARYWAHLVILWEYASRRCKSANPNMTQFLRLSLHSMPRSRLHPCQNISSKPLNTAPLSFLWWAALKGWHNSEDRLCSAFRLRSGFYHLSESQSKHTYHGSEARSWHRATRPESHHSCGPDSLRLFYCIKRHWISIWWLRWQIFQ